MPNFKLGFVLIVLIQVSLHVSSNVCTEREKVKTNIFMSFYVENFDNNFCRTICGRTLEFIVHNRKLKSDLPITNESGRELGLSK